MGKKETTNQGFSIVEVMLAVFMFAIIAVTGITTILHSYSVNRLGEEETFATLYAGELRAGVHPGGKRRPSDDFRQTQSARRVLQPQRARLL